MQITRVLRATAYTPSIRFLGKRSIPKNIDHSLKPHPEGPREFPDSFIKYRSSAQQHGPLGNNGKAASSSSNAQPQGGLFMDRDELPARFRRMVMTVAEIEAVETGGATIVW
ncbi:hypothetical protein YB2330_000470 [Saitoella coloradoensis]